MPSPFPGMDPYIESSGGWGDFHTCLIAAIRGKLNAILPRRYRARVDVFVFIHVPARPSRKRRRVEPDAYVVNKGKGPGSAAVAVFSPPSATITLPAVRKKHKSVLVIDTRKDRVVTAIEILSPSNKGEDRPAYLSKRAEYLGSGVNVVEVDLLRGGRRLPLGSPPTAVGDYYIMVSRSWELPRANLWSLTVRNPLPQVPIPLAEDQPDVHLPLRACIDRAYDEGSYDTELDNDEPVTPRLNKQDAAWARKLLAERPAVELTSPQKE